MTDKNENDLKKYVEGAVSKKQFVELEQSLENADSAKAEKIKTAKLKKPLVTTILSSVLGLFGGGSFYLGQIKRGIAKIVFNIVVPLLVICIFLVTVAPNFQKYSDQATAYDEIVVQTLNSENSTVYSSYTSDYETFATYLASTDSLLSDLSDVYDYFNERSDGIDVSTALVNLHEYLNDFYDNYVAGIGDITTLTDDIAGSIAGVIVDSETDLTGLISETLDIYFDEYEASVGVLYGYIASYMAEDEQEEEVTLSESEEDVTLPEIISDVNSSLSSVLSYLDTTEDNEENSNPDYTYVQTLGAFLNYLTLEEDGYFSEDNLSAIIENEQAVYDAIDYAYGVVYDGYAAYVDAYNDVIPEKIADIVASDYDDAYSKINMLMTWLIGNYNLPEEPDKDDYEDESEYEQKLAEYEAEYAEISAIISKIYELWQNYYLYDDCLTAYSDLNVVNNITVPESLTIDTLVGYLKEFDGTEYEMTSSSISAMLEKLDELTGADEFITEIELFTVYCEALNVFLSSQLSSAASSLSEVFDAVELMLSGDIDDLQAEIDAITAAMKAIEETDSENYAEDEDYKAYSEQLSEYNDDMSEYDSVMSALGIDYDYVGGSLKDALNSYNDDVISASDALTAYYRNLVGYTYTDPEDESNNISITGLRNEIVEGNVTVSSFITELTSMIEDIDVARKDFTDKKSSYSYQNESKSLIEITGIYVGILDGYTDDLAAWYTQATGYLVLTDSNDGTLIGEVIRNKLYKDLSLTEEMTEITGYLKTVVDSDYYDVKYTEMQSAYTATSNFSSSLSSKASEWQIVHDIVYMFFLVITIIDAVIIAAYWVGEVFRDREKCHKMNYDSIKKVFEE